MTRTTHFPSPTRRPLRPVGPSVRTRRLRTVLCAVGLLALGVAAAAGRSDRDLPSKARYHVVQTGDTLWDLAGTLETSGADKRELVWMLREVNELEGSLIRPGQALLLPADRAAVRAAVRRPAAFRQAAEVPADSLATPAG